MGGRSIIIFSHEMNCTHVLATAVGGRVLSKSGDAGEELCVDPGRYCSTRFSAPVCRCMTSIYIIILVDGGVESLAQEDEYEERLWQSFYSP